MSIPVDLARLDEALSDVGPGYLLTVSGGGAIKAVSVPIEVRDDVVVVDAPGKGSTRNIAEHPEVTLLCPPREPGGYTLLVDGRATVDDDTVTIVPSHAVLHRPIPGAVADGDECGHDCRPI